MKKIFVITAVYGYWDMSSVATICAMDFEYKAKFYCSKANAIVEKYKNYYDDLFGELMNDHDKTHPRQKDFIHIDERRDFTYGIFSYHEIEIR